MSLQQVMTDNTDDRLVDYDPFYWMQGTTSDPIIACIRQKEVDASDTQLPFIEGWKVALTPEDKIVSVLASSFVGGSGDFARIGAPKVLVTPRAPMVQPMFHLMSTGEESHHFNVSRGGFLNGKAKVEDENSVLLFHPRLPIDLEGNFSPSQLLLDFVRDGIAEYGKLLSSDAKQALDLAVANRSAGVSDAALFSRALAELLSRVALRVFDRKYASAAITLERRFVAYLQDLLLDVFPVLPSDFEKFQARLRREMIDFVNAGGLISGRWGRVAVLNDELCYILVDRLERGIESDTKWEFAASLDI